MRIVGFFLTLAFAGMFGSMASRVWSFVREDMLEKDWAEVSADLLMFTVILCLTGACLAGALAAVGVIK